MRFDFTEEQKELAAAAAEFFAGECTAADVRAMWDDATGRSPTRWRKMAETGLLGVTVPVEHGGLGLDDVTLVRIVEEAGHAALPEPLVDTVGVAAPLLAEAGTAEQQATWLPRIAAGEAVVALQLADAALVADAHVADLLIVQRGDALHAVPAGAFAVTPQPTLDPARRLGTVEVEVSAATRMRGGSGAATTAHDRGATLTAAFCNGLGARMLELTVAHVSRREQFGRPVGSFQAVAHKLADTHLAVETSRAAAWYAAYALATGTDDRRIATSVAKSTAAEAVHLAQDHALQCHGGIGFTWEHDLHLFLERALALEHAYGTARAHRERLADHVLGPSADA